MLYFRVSTAGIDRLGSGVDQPAEESLEILAPLGSFTAEEGRNALVKTLDLNPETAERVLQNLYNRGLLEPDTEREEVMDLYSADEYKVDETKKYWEHMN